MKHTLHRWVFALTILIFGPQGFSFPLTHFSDSLVVVCFGNSTTAPRKNVQEVYPVRLEKKLNNIGILTQSINAGIPGSHAASINDNNKHKVQHGMDRFQSAVVSHKPNWVIISFGINDAWQDGGVNSASRITEDKFHSSIKYFIQECKRIHANPIIVGPNPLGKNQESFRQQKQDIYTLISKKLAKSYHVPFIDIKEIFIQSTIGNESGVDHLLLDGVHPNDEGHELIATELFKIISAAADTINVNKGKHTSTGFWIHEKAKEIVDLKTGPFIHLSSNRIMTVDSNQCFISNNNGKTWKASPIFQAAENYLIRPERALIKTKKGTIILAFANDRERSAFNWKDDIHDASNAILPTYVVRSEDEGKTWSEPVKLHDDWTGAIRDIIETSDGHVVFTTMMMRHQPGHHTVLTYSSADEGKSWSRSNIIDMGGVGHHDGVTESTLEELQDGSLKMYMRTNWGYFWETTSKDHGLTWNNIKSTHIDASSSPGLFKRLKSGRLIMIWNRYYPQGKNSYKLRGGDYNFSASAVSMFREEISIMFSDDDGNTWSKPVVVGKTLDPKKQIAYPYMFEYRPGKLWLSFAFSNLRISLHEKDFINVK